MYAVIKFTMPKVRLNSILIRMSMGWRTRKILNGCAPVIELRKDLASIEGELLAFTDPKDKRIPKAMKLRRFKVEELSYQVSILS